MSLLLSAISIAKAPPMATARNRTGTASLARLPSPLDSAPTPAPVTWHDSAPPVYGVLPSGRWLQPNRNRVFTKQACARNACQLPAMEVFKMSYLILL